jgi:hypothetical protein
MPSERSDLAPRVLPIDRGVRKYREDEDGESTEEVAMNRARCINLLNRRTAVAVAAVLVLAFGAGIQPSFAASRNVDAYTTDSARGGRVTTTLTWVPGERDNKYDVGVSGTVFDRKADDGYCALAQLSLDGNVNDLGKACPNDRERGFNFPLPNRRDRKVRGPDYGFEAAQALVRVCLVKGGKFANCSEWK